MRFRTALLFSVILLIAGLATATVVAITVVIDRSVMRAVADDLKRSADVFAELQSFQEQLLTEKVRVLADEPRMKAVLGTTDITPDTVREVAGDIGRAIQADFLLVIDQDGILMVDITDPQRGFVDLRDHPLISRALEYGEARGMWIEGQYAYRTHAKRISLGDETIGVVVIGKLLHDETAESVYRLTASSVIIELDGAPMAVSSFQDTNIDIAALSGLERLQSDAPPARIDLAGTRYLAIAHPLDTGFGGTGLRYVVLRSLDRALAPGRRLQRILFIVVALALIVALASAFALARRLSRPIDKLVAVTLEVGSGDLDARAPVEGPLELRTLAAAMNDMTDHLSQSRRELAAKERLEQQMKIAADIQTSILPRQLDVKGLEIAARMIPASDIGGDYYDVLPDGSACWLAIGDVAGHGLTAGLVMLMVQNLIAATTRARRDDSPSDIFCAVNRLLVDSVRKRLDRDDHVTLTLFRYDGDRQFTYAGAHEDIIVWRKASSRCECIETRGTWMGVMAEIEEFTQDDTLELEPGDVMVLYSDGLTEAMNDAREQFGIDRVCEVIEGVAESPVDAICDQLMERARAWSPENDDDVTIVVIRRPIGSAGEKR